MIGALKEMTLIGLITHREAMVTFYKLMYERGILVFNTLTNEDAEPMFPTDERIEWKRKRKENKEKGIEFKTRTKVVEHFDDCGDNLLGLNIGRHELLMYYCPEPDYEPLGEGLCMHWLKGSEWTGTYFSTSVITVHTIDELMYYLDKFEDGMDLVELCGGEGRTSTIAIRRHLSVGENFDLVCNWDLNDPHDQQKVRSYFRKFRPLVAIMGPTCKPFGKLANYNYW